MSAPDKRTVQQLGFVINFEKYELKPTEKIDFEILGYHFDGLSKRKETKNSREIDSGHGGLITNNPKIAYVPDRCTSILGKDYTNGSVTYASSSVVSKNKLAISQLLDLKNVL